MPQGLARRGPLSERIINGGTSRPKQPRQQTGKKSFRRGDYTDLVLDLPGGGDSQAVHGIQDVAGDSEPTMVEQSKLGPPNADVLISALIL